MASTTLKRKRGKSSKSAKTSKAPARALHRSSTLSRWGNSLGVRIPQDAVDKLNLQPGAQVSFEVRADSITIKPLRQPRKWTESQLLKGVTPRKVSGEVDWGTPRGAEIW
jgi:antitoxin MazE